VHRALSSVEAAALSGTGAAVLLTLAVVLLTRQPGVGSSSKDLAWYMDSDNRFTVLLGLNLAAFGGSSASRVRSPARWTFSSPHGSSW